TVQLDVARAQTQQESDRRADFGSSLKTLKWDKKKQKALDTAPTQEAASKPGQKVSKPEEDDVLRLDTVMAVFDVLVLDAQGRSLTGFKQTDFIVNEDGQPQEIAAFSTGDGLSVPRSFVLIIDYSGSQLPYLRTSIEAAKTLVDKLAPKDRMAIVTDDVELVVEFTKPVTGTKCTAQRVAGNVAGTGKRGRATDHSLSNGWGRTLSAASDQGRFVTPWPAGARIQF
ncbi:MAG: hypothetical protein JNM09_31940, partial [Blastocatellia bacterium]|nr:hypothetical protein [Blastocatellia bacterium]